MEHKFDPLQAFLNWWLQTRALVQPETNIVKVEGQVTRTILYRDGQFQVELISLLPNSTITSHAHDSVDSFVVPVSGEFEFLVEGNGYCNANYKEPIRLLPGTLHSGDFGKRGSAFLSIQYWINGKPRFISNDWRYEDENETEKNREVA